VGRGPQLAATDLLRALDAGQLAEAVLDVTDPEPLPEVEPLWSHPRVRITPHIASLTQPQTAARVAIDNLRRHARGEPLVGLVDRAPEATESIICRALLHNHIKHGSSPPKAAPRCAAPQVTSSARRHPGQPMSTNRLDELAALVRHS
jgi:hypothetical protein